MDLLGELELKWSLGYNGSQLHFADNDTLVYGCGNTLTFVQSNGKHLRSCASEGKGVGFLAVAQKHGLLAYCETTLEPKIYILDYPSCKVHVVLEGGAQLEFVSIAFSGDGKKLASLSGLSDFKLIIWDSQDGSVICQTDVGPGGSQVSFNPFNWKHLCVVGPTRICLYSLEQCDTDNFLSPLEVETPDKLMLAGSTASPKIPPAGTVTASAEDMGRKRLERKNTKPDQGITQLSPPNMKHVLYEVSYDEFMKKKCPVKPVSHCWDAQQDVYIGCEHGQLLLVDFETGLVKVLVNPDTSVREETNPQSGHTLLREGGASILALSKRGLYAAGKNGLIYCFGLDDDVALVDIFDVGQPIVSLSWSQNYDTLAIGTGKGSISLADPLKLNNTTLICDHHYSDVVGLDVLGAGLEYCVSCKSDGVLEVWDVNSAKRVSNLDLSLNTMCSTLSCPASCNMAIIGTESGELVVVSLTETVEPQIVYQMTLHRSPLRIIQHDQNGRFMATVTDDSLVFFQDCRPSSQLAVLGYTEYLGIPLDLSIIREPEQSRIAILSQAEDKSMVTLFVLPDCILNEDNSQDVYEDASKRLSNNFVRRQIILLTQPLSSFTLVAENTAISLATLEFSKFTLPPSSEMDVEWELTPTECYPATDLKGSKAIPSFHRKWLGFGSSDGQLEVRVLKKPEGKVSGTPHSYQSGGCKFLAFSRDGQYLISAGDTGVITCWRLKFMEQGTVEKLASVEYAQRFINSIKPLQVKENVALDNMKPFDSDKTWLEIAKDTALKTEDEKYAAVKANLRVEISQLREKVLGMIATNKQLPDIEQLERQEFVLDTEEHLRMQAEEDEVILQVREEIELSNLASMFIREQIKMECWDGMAVKGCVLKAFNSHIEVSNYPMKTRTEAKLKEVSRVQALRSIEAAEKRIRTEVEDALKQTLQSLHTQDVILDDDEMIGEFDGQAKQQQQQELEKGDPDALLGSHAAQVGGANELLYDQFNLYSSIARKHQIVLLEDCVYKIKEIFNKEFDEVFRQKEMEIARIKEKNVRINKIIQQLKLSDGLVSPALDEDETPDRLLSVGDDEILVEKYLSPEEQEKMKEDAKQEEVRRLAEMGDNPRERALDMMMGGRLEANVEEDLFKDLPRPDFLSKDLSEMSEDEIRMARDFEKKETEFLEEREKLKKALEAELRKLQVSISQGMEHFDERILKLFQLKIKTEMAILQQDLIILCLTRGLLSEEEVIEKEIQLNQLLEEKKVSKVSLGSKISSTKRTTEEFHEQYEQVVAEDRELDKSFKRDFADCEPYVDQLYKLFRKRPRGHRLKQGPSNEGMKPDLKSQNPFALSSSATGKRHTHDGAGDGDPMMELDDVSHMPEGLEHSVWDRLIVYRRRKVASEQRVKAIAFKLAEMNAFLSKRQAEDDKVQHQIQDAFKELNKLQGNKMVFDLNLEVQFLLKQGQVEVDMGKFIPDFTDSVLVNRSGIEELNSQIKTLGEGKLHSMAECKDFKRGIHMLEWEHRKMRMEAEDLVEKAKDIQMLRVTKDLQQRLMEENVTSKDQNEIDTLEKTIELNQKMYKKSVRGCKKTLTKLQHEVREKHLYNQHLDLQVMECQVSVAEQQRVENLAGVPLSEANREQRMNDIVTRKQLVETIKTQDNQISVLRSELERLRMRAFPALVQID